MNRARTRRPTSPGEILRDDFLKPMGLTQKELADHLAIDIKTVNRIVNGRSAVTPELAVMLGLTFGTTPVLWLNAQMAVDLFDAEKNLARRPGRIQVRRLRAG